MARARHLADLRWTDLDPGAPPILAVPVGSCEQHGPHLPLDTDSRIAEALAHRLASVRRDVVVTPVIGVSASGEHAGFPGTLSIGSAATVTVIVELGRSADWARGLVLVNGHGGNVDAVTRAVALLRGEGRDVSAFWPRSDDADLHAGRTETSIMLALAPDAVDLDAAVRGPTPSVAELRAGGVRAVTSSGVLGDPTRATAEHGRDLLDLHVGRLVAHVDDAWPS